MQLTLLGSPAAWTLVETVIGERDDSMQILWKTLLVGALVSLVVSTCLFICQATWISVKRDGIRSEAGNFAKVAGLLLVFTLIVFMVS